MPILIYLEKYRHKYEGKSNLWLKYRNLGSDVELNKTGVSVVKDSIEREK